MLTFEQVKELVELVAAKGLRRLEIERSGFRLEIDGEDKEPAVSAPLAVAPAAVAAPVAAAPQTAAASPAPAADETAEAGPPDGSHVMTSPIVGTFYAAPSPDADAYANVGDTVRKGQVLCIVEAMKLMNEIESDVDGVVLEVYPKNAQPVEFGEPLFAIDPR